MAKRKKLSKKVSKKMFRRNAVKTDKKNLQAVPMRGGFRL